MLSPGRRLSRLILVVACCWTALAARAADDTRFSATLTPEQRTAAGLTSLSADHLAVVDGLVRQDLAASRYKNNGVDHTRFSQRHTPAERALAGLDGLTDPQLAELDEFVRLRIAADEPVPLATTPDRVAAGGVRTLTYQRPLEIHGELSYTVGWSKAGSFQGGGLVLTYDDPAHRYSILVGYSEYHGKGLPRCFLDPGAGPYRDGPAAFLGP